MAMIGGLEGKGVQLTKEFKSLTNEIADAVSIVEKMEDLSSNCHIVRSEIAAFDRDIVRLEFENSSLIKMSCLNCRQDSFY